MRYLIFAVIIFSSVNSFAQIDTTQSPKMVITLKNGTTVIGHIISSEAKHLNFYISENKQIKIAKDSVDEIVRYSDLPTWTKKQIANPKPPDTTKTIEQAIEHEDKNLNRLVIFPTARPMNPWQAYVQLSELFIPFAAVSLDKYIILGGGVSIFPSQNSQLVYLSARTTPFSYGNFYIAGGVFYVSTTYQLFNNSSFSSGFTLAYGVSTYGDKDKSITVGLGYNLDPHIAVKKPVIILGGDLRLGNGIKLITENWIPPDSDGFLASIGLRFIGKDVSGDVVFARIIDNHGKPSNIVPWFNITYNFDLKSSSQ